MATDSAVQTLKKLVKVVPPKIIVPVVVGACLLTVGIALPSKPTSLKQNPYDTNLPHQITIPKVSKLTKVPKTTSASSTPATTPAATPTTTTKSSHSTTPATTPAPASAPSPGTGVSGLSSSSSGSSGSNTSGNSGLPPVSYTSENWSGYLTTSGSFSSISASWVVPSPSGNGSSISADAAWIGIGGVTSDDLIQVGTQDTVEPSGQVSSSAFYELLPASAQNITTITVSAGDNMSANISEISAGEWSITITDETNTERFSTDVAYSSSNSSAEWIEEDPSFESGRLVPFDDYGTVSFTNCLATVNGTNENISASGGDSVTMVNRSNQPISVPSSLTNGASNFSTSWKDEP